MVRGARGEGSSRWGYCSAPHWVPMIQPNPACVDPSCPLPWPPQTRPTQRPILSVEGVCGSQPRVTEIKARGQALTPKPRHPPPRPPLLGCSPAIHLHGTGCSLLAVPIGASRGFRGKGPGHILHPLDPFGQPPLNTHRNQPITRAIPPHPPPPVDTCDTFTAAMLGDISDRTFSSHLATSHLIALGCCTPTTSLTLSP